MSELLNQYKKASNENYKLRAKLDKERGENVKLEIINEKNCLVNSGIVSSLNNKLQIAVEALNELGHVGVELEHGQPYECNVAQVAQEALEKIKELG